MVRRNADAFHPLSFDVPPADPARLGRLIRMETDDAEISQ
jgi:hypothetical protein